MTTFKDRRQPNNSYYMLKEMKYNSTISFSIKFLSCKSKNSVITEESKVVSHVDASRNLLLQHVLTQNLAEPSYLNDKSKTKCMGIKRIRCLRRTYHGLRKTEMWVM